MNYKVISAVFLTMLISGVTAQIISEEKNLQGSYGVFGGTIQSGLPGLTFERYLNISSNSIEVSQSNLVLEAKPDLTLNGSGGNVNLGGEVNRAATTSADLLPYAYGETEGLGVFSGTGNYTATTVSFMNSNNQLERYTEITFNDTGLDTHDLFIIVTPKDGDTGFLTPQEFATQSRVVNEFTDNNKVKIFLYNRNGVTANWQYFSFVAYKL